MSTQDEEKTRYRNNACEIDGAISAYIEADQWIKYAKRKKAQAWADIVKANQKLQDDFVEDPKE